MRLEVAVSKYWLRSAVLSQANEDVKRSWISFSAEQLATVVHEVVALKLDLESKLFKLDVEKFRNPPFSEVGILYTTRRIVNGSEALRGFNPCDGVTQVRCLSTPQTKQRILGDAIKNVKPVPGLVYTSNDLDLWELHAFVGMEEIEKMIVKNAESDHRLVMKKLRSEERTGFNRTETPTLTDKETRH